MYLSCLEIDLNAVRGRTWLANPYRVHQRLLMAFPDGEAGRLLFRIEADRHPPRVLVQSPGPADWERAFADHPVLTGVPLWRELHLSFDAGQRLRFLLRANPTARRGIPREAAAGNRLAGHRVGLLKEDEQRRWLERKGEVGGFRPLWPFEVRSAGQIAFERGDGGGKQTHVSVDFEGYLEVVDAPVFAAMLDTGIGSAKAFGFGLLSVAPV